jgi:hypothetical protein
MKRVPLVLAAVVALSVAGVAARAGVREDLAAAAAAGHPAFLVVTEAGARGTDRAVSLASGAAAIVPGSVVVEMDRADPANAEVVARYQLKVVPVPLVLVIAGNGVAAGGAKPHLVTAAQLARMVPTKAKAEHLKVVSDGLPDFVVFARAATPGRAEALAACRDAVARLKGKAGAVVVDLDDAAEIPFAEEMRLDPKAAKPWVLVFNAKGQRTATLEGVPEAAALVEASAKVPSSGCCPGGGPCK